LTSDRAGGAAESRRRAEERRYFPAPTKEQGIEGTHDLHFDIKRNGEIRYRKTSQ
jgi:hypothetical protein